MFSSCDHVVALSILAEDVAAAAWADCKSLRILDIGNGVLSVGKQAFKNCSRLEAVSLGGQVLTIGAEAFRDCSSLTSVVLGSKLDYLGMDVFSGCHALTAATVPSPLPRRIVDVFDCSILTSVTFLRSATTIAEAVLKDCTSVVSVHMFDNITSVGEYAFAHCSSLSSVTMSSQIRSIGAWAFWDCANIISLPLSDTVESIGRGAFQGCTSLAYMELPPNLTDIADFTFSGCSALEHLTARGVHRELVEGGLSRINYIGKYAFHVCARLEMVDIGVSVTSVGEYAFAGCSSLASTPSLKGLTKLEDYVFANCSGLRHVLIPEGVIAIQQGAFYNCSSLQSLEWGIELNRIGDDTITIGKSAFRYCKSLRNLTIPASVAWIEEDAFQNTELDGATIFPRDDRIVDQSAFPPGVVTECGNGFELIVKGCACPEGKMFVANSRACSPCGLYFDCPGGHLEADPSIYDATVSVKEGYMTIENDPFSVYRCVKALRCAGNRQVLTNMCTEGFDPASVRCATCLPDMYLSDGTCKSCTGVDGGFMMAKLVAVGVVQLLFRSIAFYINVNSPKSASQGTIESLVDFVQIVQTLSRLDIVAPDALQSFFDLLNLFTIPGIFKTLDFKPECTFGTFGGTITYSILKDTLTPLVLFFNLAMMQVLFILCGRTLRRDFVHNLVCLVFANLFISLVTLSFSLFYTERMPNGKNMVIAFPQLEYGTSSWKVYLPINLFASVSYGLTMYSYVAYTVFTAPRRVGTEPGFLARYRFCFGTKRPDRWWWIMVKMSFGLSLCLVQVVLPAKNVHAHVYTSALFMFLVTVIMYGAWPWKFDSNNWVELMCKIGLIILLMLTTSFIDVNSVPQIELEQMRNIWAFLIICTLVIIFIVALALFTKDLIFSMHRVRIKQVRTAQAMWHLRDMSLALLMMPEKEYARRLAAIGDSDRALLLEVTKNIKNVIFGQQESSHWTQQRLIAGKEHEVWDHGKRVIGFLQESKSGRLQERLEQSMQFRMHSLKLARAISQSRPTISSSSSSRLKAVPMLRYGSISSRHSDIRSVMKSVRSLPSEEVGTNWTNGIADWMKRMIFSDAELTKDAFRRKIFTSFPHLNIPEDGLDMLFSVLDNNGSGTVTHQKLTDLLAALAPRKVLLAMDPDDEEDDAVDSDDTSPIQTPQSGGEGENENEDVPANAETRLAPPGRSLSWSGSCAIRSISTTSETNQIGIEI
ncbi:unnamed protein product [Prorocentrum cordatum]|uniref:EF-hand domain-containing protein n=1 Tax=Prorocentrum cordatum TaxID=2364126 RepID=A0ABN9TLA8_9DINO|nr:unnamed protein product [Polarella glacialis]